MNDSAKWTELCIPDGCSVDCENGVCVNGVSVDIDKEGNLIGNRKEIKNKIVQAQQTNANVWVGKGIGSMRGGNIEFNF